MSHDIFVSYSVKDKTIADAVAAGLESEALRCWMAPRDVLPGSVWGEAIVNAIESSRIMVLILSGNSNRSRQVLREIEQAVSNEVIILPFRIEAIDPSGAMSYYLATEHWLDALTPPMERHIERLTASIQALLSGEPSVDRGLTPLAPAPQAAAAHRKRSRWPLLIGSLGVVAILGLGLLVALASRGGSEEASSATTATTSTTVGSIASSAPTSSVAVSTSEAAVTTTSTFVSVDVPADTVPPPMFAVPTGALVEIVQAAARWRQNHDATDADLEANAASITDLAEEARSEWATLIEEGDASELGRSAPLAFCQLMEDGVPPDDVAALIAATAGDINGAGAADYTFSGWVGTVGTTLACPEEAPSWSVATGALGGDLLLSVDFEDGAPGWLTGVLYDAGSIVVEAGLMKLAPSPGGYILGSVNSQSFSDVVVDVWVQPVGFDEMASYGVSCHERSSFPSPEFYMFDINGQDAFDLWYYDSSGRGNHIAGDYSSAIKPPPETNHLTVFCGDLALALLINGELVAYQQHEALTQGQLSLVAWSEDREGVDIRFDNLIVRAASPDALALLDAIRTPIPCTGC